MDFFTQTLALLLALPWFVKTAILAAAYAATDRFNGGGLGWRQLSKDHGGPLPGRGIYYAGPWLALVCFALGSWPGLCLGVIWGLYRAALGFPTGTLTGRDIQAASIRHALLWPAVLVVLAVFHLSIWAIAPFVLYTAAAVVLAKWNGDVALDSEHPKDINAFIEPDRGALYGLAQGIALALG